MTFTAGNLRPQGYAHSIDRETGLLRREVDTFTCAHCNSVVHLPHKADPNKDFGFCTLCMKPTCAKAACHACMPFEKKLDLMEQEARRNAEMRRFICEALER